MAPPDCFRLEGAALAGTGLPARYKSRRLQSMVCHFAPASTSSFHDVLVAFSLSNVQYCEFGARSLGIFKVFWRVGIRTSCQKDFDCGFPTFFHRGAAEALRGVVPEFREPALALRWREGMVPALCYRGLGRTPVPGTKGCDRIRRAKLR
jgi:hypothetical protein